MQVQLEKLNEFLNDLIILKKYNNLNSIFHNSMSNFYFQMKMTITQ